MSFALALSAAVWTQPSPVSLSALQTEGWTKEQLAEGEYLWPSIEEQCGKRVECLKVEMPKLVDAVNAVAELDYRFGYLSIVRRARDHCRSSSPARIDITKYATCMRGLSISSKQIVHQTLSYKTLGVSCDGYDALEDGMDPREISLLLGRYGTQLSRAQIGNQSSSAYEWKTRNGAINIVLQNGRMAAKGQFNIC